MESTETDQKTSTTFRKPHGKNQNPTYRQWKLLLKEYIRLYTSTFPVLAKNS